MAFGDAYFTIVFALSLIQCIYSLKVRYNCVLMSLWCELELQYLLQWMELITDQVQDAIMKSLIGARETFLQIRFHMRQMGEAAGVPV